MKNFWSAVLGAFAFAGCFSGCAPSSVPDGGLVVSIEPLKYLVEGVVGDDFPISVLVPAGVSPENYEPTPSQIAAAEGARAVFVTGLLDFERALTAGLPDRERVVDLSAGIEVMAGTCAHAHEDTHGAHAHGVDPHIWMSPRQLRTMARSVYGRIHALFPDSVAYGENYALLDAELRALDSIVGARVAASGARSFAIFHPGLTYFARDYGLEQIALETDGKEPSVKQLEQTIMRIRAEKIGRVLYQKEYPVAVVEVVAAEIGARPAEIDILSADIDDNILKITDLITEK